MVLEEVEGACPSAGANGVLPVCSQLPNLTCSLSVRTFVSDLPSSEQTPLAANPVTRIYVRGFGLWPCGVMDRDSTREESRTFTLWNNVTVELEYFDRR